MTKSRLITVACRSRSPAKDVHEINRESSRGSMDTDLDYDLSPDQWEALKALRLTASARRRTNASALQQLIALELAAINNGSPCLTPTGRRVLIRGSSSLWDVAT
jgi:hypothetical protein